MVITGGSAVTAKRLVVNELPLLSLIVKMQFWFPLTSGLNLMVNVWVDFAEMTDGFIPSILKSGLDNLMVGEAIAPNPVLFSSMVLVID